MHIAYENIGTILGACVIISLAMCLDQVDYMKYILIFASGLYVFYIIFLFALYLDCDGKVVILSATLMLNICITLSLSILSLKYMSLIYYAVFSGVVIIEQIIFLILVMNDLSLIPGVAGTGVLLVLYFIWVMFYTWMDVPHIKYAFVFVFGLLVVCIIGLICSLCENDIEEVLGMTGGSFAFWCGIYIVVGFIMVLCDFPNVRTITLRIIIGLVVIAIIICCCCCANSA